MKYFIEKNGKQLGPYDQEMIKAMYRDGMLDSGCHLWREGFETWQPIEVINQEPGVETAVIEKVPPPISYFGTYDSDMKQEAVGNDTCSPYSPYANSEIRRKNRARIAIPSYNPISAFVSCMKRYAQFEGRACRSEFWFWQLSCIIIDLFIQIISSAPMYPESAYWIIVSGGIFMLSLILPTIAVGVRRLHDTGNSGWFILVPIYRWILFLSDTQRKPNKYGKAPLPPEK